MATERSKSWFEGDNRVRMLHDINVLKKIKKEKNAMYAFRENSGKKIRCV
jgi:hypothetical protein